jgi:hypothetical protein
MTDDEIRVALTKALDNELWEKENSELGHQIANERLTNRLLAVVKSTNQIVYMSTPTQVRVDFLDDEGEKQSVTIRADEVPFFLKVLRKANCTLVSLTSLI